MATFEVISAAAIGGGGGGTTTLQGALTYDELVVKINAGTLVVGQQYKIIDYATKHYIVDAGGTQYLDTIITGVNEALIVTATSTNTIDKVAYSVLHPEDIIYYDWNPANWLDDLSFADLTGSPVIVTGFKGVIYFRHDTLLDNYMGYDFRNCKFRSWKTNCITWDGGTTFNKGDTVNHAGFIYRSLADSNTNNTPASSSDFWVQLIDLSLTQYWCNNPTSFNGITSGIEYIDTLTFHEGTGTATYNLCCRSNHFEPYKDDHYDFDLTGTILSNNVFFLQDNSFFQVFLNSCEGGFGYNRIGSFFQSNQCGNNFIKNLISNNAEYNEFGNGVQGNVIKGQFLDNKIIGQFQQNYIGNFFQRNITGSFFTGNTIGKNFEYNTGLLFFQANYIKNRFNKNTVGYGFQNCKCANDFTNNQIADSGCDGIDFSSATHVYANYSTVLFLNANNDKKLSYFDASDVLTVVNANA